MPLRHAYNLLAMPISPSAAAASSPAAEDPWGTDPARSGQPPRAISGQARAVLNETNLVCDANSGLINLGDGILIDTQSDLSHARQMIDLFGTVWS